MRMSSIIFGQSVRRLEDPERLAEPWLEADQPTSFRILKANNHKNMLLYIDTERVEVIEVHYRSSDSRGSALSDHCEDAQFHLHHQHHHSASADRSGETSGYNFYRMSLGG